MEEASFIMLCWAEVSKTGSELSLDRLPLAVQ